MTDSFSLISNKYSFMIYIINSIACLYWEKIASLKCVDAINRFYIELLYIPVNILLVFSFITKSIFLVITRTVKASSHPLVRGERGYIEARPVAKL